MGTTLTQLPLPSFEAKRPAFTVGPDAKWPPTQMPPGPSTRLTDAQRRKPGRIGAVGTCWSVWEDDAEGRGLPAREVGAEDVSGLADRGAGRQ